MKKWTLLFVLSIFNIGNHVSGQEASNPETDDELLISGYADVYYQFNLNRNNIGLTSFTEKHNSFELGMANIVFSKNWKKTGIVIDLGFGPRADIANGYSGSTLAAIKQLYLTYAFTDKITLTAGNFSTYIGYEVIDAPGNFNYSTSYLFSYGPFYHTGLKLDYVLNEVFGFMIGVFDDTDSKSDLNFNKNYGGQISISGTKMDLFLSFLGGKQGEDSLNIKAYLFDLTTTFQLTEKFMLGVNTSHKTTSYGIDEQTGTRQDNDIMFGTAVYTNYWLSGNVGIGLRGEYFSDPKAVYIFDTNQFPGGGSIVEFTLSVNLKSGPLTFIPEFRIDKASGQIFTDKEGNSDDMAASMLAAVYITF